MGMTISVLRQPRGPDCTMRGVSSWAERLTVVNVEGPFEPRPDAPAVILEEHVPGCLRLVPRDLKASGAWAMFGGNYAATCDSRFRQACETLLGHRFYGAVAIHDRVEG